MELCGECLRLEQQLRAASEYHVKLIVQHDQLIREGKPDASTLDLTIQRARRRRNAAGRLLLYNWLKHTASRTTSAGDFYYGLGSRPVEVDATIRATITSRGSRHLN